MKFEDANVREQNKNAWRAVTAKVGQTNVAEIRVGGSLQECHDKRKKVRQAVNAIVLDQSNREPTQEEHMAMDHASNLIAGLSTMIDDLDNARDSGVRNRRSVMRNAADFQRHYQRGDASFSRDEIGIDEFFKGVANLPTTSAVRNALSVGTNTAGGFTVPSILMPRILEAMVPNSALMQAGMGVVDISDMQGKEFTTAVIDTVPTAGWRNENSPVAESDPAFRAVTAVPRSLAFFFKVSRELLADAPNIQDALMLAIGQAFAKALDATGLRGSGAAPEPLGLKGVSGIQSVTNGANGTAISGYSNFFSALEKLLQADAPMPTAAIMSPRTLIKLGGLVDTTGQPLTVPKMLSDIPFLSTSQIPNTLTVGTSTDCSEIYMGDFSRMECLMRENISVQLLDQRFAEVGQVGFICHVRADFVANYPKAFALITGVR